jgi:hypothetical protein
MQKRSYVFSLLALLVSLLSYIPARAQDTPVALSLLQPVPGVISESQPEQRWTFEGSQGQRLSVRMQATSGDLDPYVELLDSAGNILTSGSNGSLRNATIDAMIIPENGVYTLRATRVPNNPATVGGYTLTLLPGFSFMILNDALTADSPLRTWRNPNSAASITNGKLRLQLTADSAYTWTTADKLGMFKDVYIQADFQSEQTGGYWESGLVLRGVKKDNALDFYVFFVNSDGKWKFALGQPGSLITIQDWQALPTSLTDSTTIGALLVGNKITLFYDNQPLTELTDDALAEPGLVGVAIGTGKAPNNSSSILFDNVVVTLPADKLAGIPIQIPAKLVEWQRTPDAIIEELQKERLIPSAGKPGFAERVAYATRTSAGITYQPLAQSLSFTDVIYSADIAWDSTNENIACALELRATDDKNFTIFYFDRKGGYGVRQEAGADGVVASLYNVSGAILKENQATNRVILIALGNTLLAYINGELVAQVNVKQTSGAAYVVAYNYERVASLCQFNNIWLRSFDQ